MKQITADEFKKEVLEAQVPVVADFFATWCGPCKMIMPILDQLEEEFGEQVKFVKIDVDQAVTTASEYGIRSVPTLIFFKNGEIVDKVLSVLPKAELKSKIAGIL